MADRNDTQEIFIAGKYFYAKLFRANFSIDYLAQL
jgi:hypothetical protein